MKKAMLFAGAAAMGAAAMGRRAKRDPRQDMISGPWCMDDAKDRKALAKQLQALQASLSLWPNLEPHNVGHWVDPPKNIWLDPPRARPVAPGLEALCMDNEEDRAALLASLDARNAQAGKWTRQLRSSPASNPYHQMDHPFDMLPRRKKGNSARGRRALRIPSASLIRQMSIGKRQAEKRWAENMLALAPRSKPYDRWGKPSAAAQEADQLRAYIVALGPTKKGSSARGRRAETKQLTKRILSSLDLLSHHEIKPKVDRYLDGTSISFYYPPSMAKAYIEDHLNEQLGSQAAFTVDAGPRKIRIFVGLTPQEVYGTGWDR